MKTKISTGTILRTSFLLLALTNQTLNCMGKSPLPINNAVITDVVTLLVTLLASLTNWWKNNSFTKAALHGDKMKQAIKVQDTPTA